MIYRIQVYRICLAQICAEGLLPGWRAECCRNKATYWTWWGGRTGRRKQTHPKCWHHSMCHWGLCLKMYQIHTSELLFQHPFCHLEKRSCYFMCILYKWLLCESWREAFVINPYTHVYSLKCTCAFTTALWTIIVWIIYSFLLSLCHILAFDAGVFSLWSFSVCFKSSDYFFY